MNHSEQLFNHIIKEARRVDWEVRPMPLLPIPQSADRPPIPPDQAVQVEIRSTFAGLYPIIVAGLGESLEGVRIAWGAAQRQAAVARTSVASDSGEDLVLILVGPGGSKENAEWRSIAMEIERNDLVCRKLVWLPPKKPVEGNAALMDFMKRTFLSKPWLVTEGIPQTALDTLSEKNTALLGWEEILDAQPINRADVDYDALVVKLIHANQP